MGRYHSNENIGLRNIDTDELIAVYPQKIEGNDQEVEQKVKDWYYMQGCSAEETLRSSYVDILSEKEAINNKDVHTTCR